MGGVCTFEPNAGAGAGGEAAPKAEGCAAAPNVIFAAPKAGVVDGCVLTPPKAGVGAALNGVELPNANGLGALLVEAFVTNGFGALLLGGDHMFSLGTEPNMLVAAGAAACIPLPANGLDAILLLVMLLPAKLFPVKLLPGTKGFDTAIGLSVALPRMNLFMALLGSLPPNVGGLNMLSVLLPPNVKLNLGFSVCG